MQSGIAEYKKYTAEEQQRLLVAIAEQLKLPLLQISHLAELGETVDDPATTQLLAGHGLQLLDHYLLSLRLNELTEADLEPVSLSSVLHSTAHELQDFANLYHCDLQLELAGQYEPVMAHPSGLKAALRSLTSVLIEAQDTQHKRGLVTLAAHRSRWGLVAGTYVNDASLNTEVFRRAKKLYGTSRQPLNHVLSSAGAGVFVADALFRTMASQLRPAKHHKRNGLAATLVPVQQLALV